MVQERFKTEKDNFETGSVESGSPFNLHYLVEHQTGGADFTYETEKDNFETGSVESGSPFNLQYIESESMEDKYAYEEYKEYIHSQKETIQNTDFYKPGPAESGSPFNLQYIESESMEDKYAYEEYINSQKEAIQNTDFYKSEHLIKARDFELFSSEVQDQEFRDVPAEIASDSENKFQKYMQNKGDNRYFENLLSDPKFEGNFNQFFETEYGPLISGVQNEFEKLSNYVNRNSDPGMNYEDIQSLIDSFEVEPEHLFGGLGKLAKAIVNKGKKLIKKGLKVASKVGNILLSWSFNQDNN